MEKYLKKIKEIIISKTGLEHDEIERESYFEDDLNIGEMDLIDIIEEIEDVYKIDIIDYKDDIDTVQDLIELITEQIE